MSSASSAGNELRFTQRPLRTVRAAVLCGGVGKRLRPLTYYFQKAMIPVGKRQKPLLEYVIALLRRHGLRDVVLLVGYKAEQIRNYFEDGSRFGVRLTYVHDDPQYRGTAGALYNAYARGHLRADHVLVYYGDILSNVNLSELLDYHIINHSAATLALSRGYRVRVGVAHLDADGRVTKFEEKPQLELPVSIGVLVLSARSFRYLEEVVAEHESPDVMSHLIPLMIERGERVMGYVTDAFWYDVGSIERYEKLEEMADALEEVLVSILS
ncbi:MAG: hypothetical protein DRJ56_07215 [Thermoprotei archaeon]|nr:MAG: hypothetical protein DRJ56_07215 [Thermoprotei archaeon]